MRRAKAQWEARDCNGLYSLRPTGASKIFVAQGEMWLQVPCTSSDKKWLVRERQMLRWRVAKGWELRCWYFVGKTGFWGPAISQRIDRFYLNNVCWVDLWVFRACSPEWPKGCRLREAENSDLFIPSCCPPPPPPHGPYQNRISSLKIITCSFQSCSVFFVKNHLLLNLSFFSPSEGASPQWRQRN